MKSGTLNNLQILAALNLSIGAFLLSHAAVASMDSPTPPGRYTWEACPEIKGALLRPDGWHFRKHIDADDSANLISKENTYAEGEFTTWSKMISSNNYRNVN